MGRKKTIPSHTKFYQMHGTIEAREIGSEISLSQKALVYSREHSCHISYGFVQKCNDVYSSLQNHKEIDNPQTPSQP